MTEAEWLSCTDTAMLWESDYLWRRKRGQKPRVSDRKYRLFAVACSRRIWDRFHIDLCRRAIEISECYADGQSTDSDLEAIGLKIETFGEQGALSEDDRWSLGVAASHAWDRSYALAAHVSMDCAFALGQNPRVTDRIERQAQCDFIRDMFQNPFRPVAFIPSWRTDNVVALAAQMYESRDFSAMPILADALQDAGCDNDDILNHCRDANQVHVRGCWVVDLVLGKE